MSDALMTPALLMGRAMELAQRGLGLVEPNPPVGAVIVDEQSRVVGEGFHQRYGGPHAEVHALQASGERARLATMYVTLEPCGHHGKTPPCTDALIAAGIRRVVIGMIDPNPQVAGAGVAQLQAAGIQVETGLLQNQVARLIAPFVKRVTTGRPYVHAKWAMTLDGKIASRTHHSQWISCKESRSLVHRLRGRMDGIFIGSGTVQLDDPLLTARPPGPRTASRIVADSTLKITPDAQLVRTAPDVPVIIATSKSASLDAAAKLEQLGVEILRLPSGDDDRIDLGALLDEFGRREMTNLLVEGGSQLLGSLFDQQLIDELHVFIAPKLVGGASAVTAVSGTGLDRIPSKPQLVDPSVQQIGTDLYINGPIGYE